MHELVSHCSVSGCKTLLLRLLGSTSPALLAAVLHPSLFCNAVPAGFAKLAAGLAARTTESCCMVLSPSTPPIHSHSRSDRCCPHRPFHECTQVWVTAPCPPVQAAACAGNHLQRTACSPDSRAAVCHSLLHHPSAFSPFCGGTHQRTHI